MVEVFRTNISNPAIAARLVQLIHQEFEGCKANFDLQDCDRILRIKSTSKLIPCSGIISLIADEGFFASILPDELPGLIESHLNNILRIA